MSLATYSFKDKLLYLIIIFLGFQQFPVIRIGGSFKIYELLGFVLMIYNLLHLSKGRNVSNISLYAFVFFIAVPITGYIYSSLVFEYPGDYYLRWPKSNRDFKASYYLFPLMQLFYLAMNYSVFNSLINSTSIYLNFNKLIKVAITLATIISLYSLFALYVVDFISLLPEYLQNKHNNGNRSTGLSQEPGTYVLYQTWICLFLWFSKSNYKKGVWIFLFLINVISLLLTQSTALLGLFYAIAMSIFIFKSSISSKSKAIFGLVIVVCLIYYLIQLFGYQNTFENFFVNKVQSFVTKKGHSALESGGTRKYLSDIGFRIFADNPFLGVGYGRSMYYMYLYQYKVGISVFVEPMYYGSTPLNLFSLICAEMGVIGFVAFCVFYIAVMLKLWRNRNKSEYHKMFLLGGFVEFATLFSLYTPHALFLWGYLGLGLGYIRYFDRKVALDNYEKNIESVQLIPLKF